MPTAEYLIPLALLGLALAASPLSAGEPEDAMVARRLEWFQDLKFGFMMHWGPYSQWGCIESWPLIEVDKWARPDDLAAWVERGKDIERFKRDYFALNRTFNPTKFDPAPWAAAAKRAGMKYVVFTTKHHDGFSMFDTRQTDYRITLTRKGGAVYAIYLAEDGRDAPPPEIALGGLSPAAGSEVTMLGAKERLAWRADGAGAIVALPPSLLQSPPCRHAWVLKLTPRE